MVNEFIKVLPIKLDKTIDYLISELSTIHTGRASVSLVDEVMVSAYGGKQPLKAVANITIPEARQIVIQPWDRAMIGPIESAIRDSDLGFNPVNTGDVVRINIPELTEERRREFVKIAKGKAEEARIAIRGVRSDVWNEIKKAKVDGAIGEDDMYSGETELQKMVDTYNKKIEEILAKKEKELLEV